MTNPLKELQVGDVVAFAATFTKSIKNAKLRKDFCKSRGKIQKIDGGMALIKWSTELDPRWTNVTLLALYYRPSNVEVA